VCRYYAFENWRLGRAFWERVAIADLDNLQINDGARLLWELGAKRWGDHELAAASQELRQVAGEFKGHALALTLLARFLAVLHTGDIRKRTLVPHLEELPEQSGGQASRIMRSYERMLRGKPELSILHLLGLFDRPADADALRSLMRNPRIKGVTGGLEVFNGTQWKFAVESLRAFRLLDPQSPELPNMLDCHPLIREQFGYKLRQENESGWRKCHLRLYEHFGRWEGKSSPETWEQIEPLYRAVEHGCKAGKHQRAFDQIYEPLIVQKDEKGNDRYFSLKVLGAFASDMSAISGFFTGPEPWRQPVDGLNSKTKGIVLGIAGWELRAVGRLREAKEAHDAVLERLKSRKKLSPFDLVECAINAAHLSELCLLLGEVRDSVFYGRECVVFADKSGDVQQKIVKRARLADSLHQAGEFQEAQEIFGEAEASFREFKPGRRFISGWPGFWLCDLLLSLGKPDEVLKRVRQTLKVAEERRSLTDIGLDHLSRGLAKLQKSSTQRPAGERDLRAAVAKLRDAEMQEFPVRALLALAAFHRLSREFDDAWDDLEQAKEIAERGEMKLFLTDYNLEATRLSLAEMKRQDADAHFTEACRSVTDAGYVRRASDVSSLAKRLGKAL
jgi:tetratricopeptide (TPR) repeat protein